MDRPVTQATIDFADARKKMVDGQIRPNRVNDPAILAAMGSLPRERFLPPALAARAYTDENVPLGNGRYLAEPRAIAKLVQLVAPLSSRRILLVGAGTGYTAALLAACGAAVTALEEDAALLATARPVLATLAPSVTVAQGKLAAGWAAGAPYDVILVDGAMQDIPQTVAAQLRPGTGRLIGVRAGRGLASQAIIAEMTQAGLTIQDVFDCAMPVLPAFRAEPGFVF